MSVCRKHKIAIVAPPNIEIHWMEDKNKESEQNLESRHIPYPPSLRSKAAKIIDPIIGASTWAFGSHKWNRNIGNLIKKANNMRTKFIFLKIEDIEGLIRTIKLLDICLQKNKITNSKGKEPEIVYIIIAMAAGSRSGWYPHPIIIRKIGIREASNKK